MALFKVSRPRVLAYLALEMGLVAAVIVGLAQATGLLFSDLEHESAVSTSILSLGLLYCAALAWTQSSNLGDDGSLLRELVVFAIVSLALGVVSFSAMRLYSTHGDPRLAEWVALECIVAVPIVVAAWRWLSVRYNVFNSFRERVLILGTDESASKVCRWLVADHSHEFGVIGFADTDDSRIGTVLAMGARIQTDYASLPTFAPPRVDRVVVALDEKRGRLPVRELMELRLRGIEIEDATTLFERVAGKIAVETMLPSWLIFSEGFKVNRLRQAQKRLVDLVLSLTLLVLTFPLMLLTALLVRLDSPGPILYRQDRLGLGGREFMLMKFRSMRVGAESKSGPMWAAKFDPRVTRVGKVLRKLRIDELPQLFNVLRGEMSFVGPRPERRHFVTQLEKEIPYYALRMTARPGLTGWAQVMHGYADSAEDAMEKLKYDLYYIKNCNVWLDLWIVLKTVRVVLAGSGAH